MPTEAPPSRLRTALRAELEPLLGDLRVFVDRRIAELSAEVHGATELMDFSETALTGQLTALREQLGQMTAAPAAATRTSGLELEAVVQATETAANQILEAAEAISTCVRQALPDAAAAAVAARLDAIFEACAFQDITGQRVRRAIAQLRHMETALGAIVTPGTEVVAPPAPTVVSTGADLPQADIDALFAA